mmetsp:Transcript_15000/g.26555  ORF Transcript_15000/g.26555 Transcript_15000/m.26555 type:complete len:108 (+) Transcript_15000:116-439(+)
MASELDRGGENSLQFMYSNSDVTYLYLTCNWVCEGKLTKRSIIVGLLLATKLSSGTEQTLFGVGGLDQKSPVAMIPNYRDVDEGFAQCDYSTMMRKKCVVCITLNLY